MSNRCTPENIHPDNVLYTRMMYRPYSKGKKTKAPDEYVVFNFSYYNAIFPTEMR